MTHVLVEVARSIKSAVENRRGEKGLVELLL